MWILMLVGYLFLLVLKNWVQLLCNIITDNKWKCMYCESEVHQFLESFTKESQWTERSCPFSHLLYSDLIKIAISKVMAPRDTSGLWFWKLVRLLIFGSLYLVCVLSLCLAKFHISFIKVVISLWYTSVHSFATYPYNSAYSSFLPYSVLVWFQCDLQKRSQTPIKPARIMKGKQIRLIYGIDR